MSPCRFGRRPQSAVVLERFSGTVAHWTGSSAAFASRLRGDRRMGSDRDRSSSYSNTWQLVINTGTTIVTFLMVFLIQRAQNKDARAIQLKLNELVAAIDGASNRLDRRRGLVRGRAGDVAPLLQQAGTHGPARRRHSSVTLDRRGARASRSQAESGKGGGSATMTVAVTDRYRRSRSRTVTENPVTDYTDILLTE